MDLGAFSVSLSVKDLAASHAFYAQLGFEQIGGEATQNWLILKNGEAIVGLFQGMFEGNLLTFNPGWAGSGEHPDTFQDVRDIERRLKEAGIETLTSVDGDQGPGSLTLKDPDGNVILLDQHR